MKRPAPVPTGDVLPEAVGAKRTLRGFSSGGVLALSCLLVGTTALAGGANSDRRVIVTTRIIMGSDHGVGRAHDIAGPALGDSLSMFGFKAYRLLQQEARPVSLSAMEDFPVPGQRHLLVQPTGFNTKRVSLDVMLMEGQKILVNTAVKLKNGGEFLVTGPQHEGGTLFLAIGARVPVKRARPGPSGVSQGLLLRPVESR